MESGEVETYIGHVEKWEIEKWGSRLMDWKSREGKRGNVEK